MLLRLNCRFIIITIYHGTTTVLDEGVEELGIGSDTPTLQEYDGQ